MIVYVDMEHDSMRARPRMWEKSLAVRLRDKFRLEEISGEPCLIVRYKQVTPAMLDELGVRAVVVSGCYSDFEHYSEESLAGLAAIYQDAGRPMLGICAGHQMMAEYSGASIGPIGPLPPGAEDAHAGSLGWGENGSPESRQRQVDIVPVRLTGGTRHMERRGRARSPSALQIPVFA